MLEKMKKILAHQLDLDESEITPESRFKEDLEADSLDLFELLTTLEEQYEIEIPAEDMEQLTTVGAVMDYLKTKGIEEKTSVEQTERQSDCFRNQKADCFFSLLVSA